MKTLFLTISLLALTPSSQASEKWECYLNTCRYMGPQGVACFMGRFYAVAKTEAEAITAARKSCSKTTGYPNTCNYGGCKKL